mgnify:CR=1 FL=1
MTDYKNELQQIINRLMIAANNHRGNAFLLNSDNRKALSAIEALLSQHSKKRELEVDENTSDGYHTFKELYEYRMLYNALLFNEWAKNGDYGVHKSKLHSDGEVPFGGGWFVVSAQLPIGQVTNHYELKDWDLFQIPENTRAAKWDGHTPQEAAIRLRALANGEK